MLPRQVCIILRSPQGTRVCMFWLWHTLAHLYSGTSAPLEYHDFLCPIIFYAPRLYTRPQISEVGNPWAFHLASGTDKTWTENLWRRILVTKPFHYSRHPLPSSCKRGVLKDLRTNTCTVIIGEQIVCSSVSSVCTNVVWTNIVCTNIGCNITTLVSSTIPSLHLYNKQINIREIFWKRE